ncbi:hypothetical protein ACH4S8_03980 [Streptomyces sp. NPDC021080]|uniref:hypothetical protein n=1 Tax=Streptomyces sp. NPDC021080 TaxID=3365110 RepID=UPI00379783DC
MRRLPVASALVTVAVTVATASGCSSAAPAAARNAAADVRVGVCAMDEPSGLQGLGINSASCAITVDNRATSMRAYTIDLTCTSYERTTPFAAGSMLYYVPAGRHTISSTGIVTSGSDRNVSCRTGWAKVEDLTSDDGSPEPWPSPTGALADAVAAADPDATPTPGDTASGTPASASAAVTALQYQALARTYPVGDYTVSFTTSGYDSTSRQIDLGGTVTSRSSDTDTMKRTGLVVTLLRADGSVDARGTLCVDLNGSTSDAVDTTLDDGTPDWTTIRITRGSATEC